MLDINSIALWGLGIICSALGWFASELYSAIKELKQSLSQLEIRISNDFVRYDRMQDLLKPIMDSLMEIKISMINKLDKN